MTYTLGSDIPSQKVYGAVLQNQHQDNDFSRRKLNIYNDFVLQGLSPSVPWHNGNSGQAFSGQPFPLTLHKQGI